LDYGKSLETKIASMIVGGLE